MKSIKAVILFIGVMGLNRVVSAGPYNEPGVSGYVGANGTETTPDDPNAMLNPIFRGWADGVAGYEPTPEVGWDWMDYTLALGPVTADQIDIVSLGDLTQNEINQGWPAGLIILTFGNPGDPNDPAHIRDGNGYDFAVFENGFATLDSNSSAGYIAGQVFAELGYVEVSSDGVHFARFAGVSLTPGAIPSYGTSDITDIYNLAGKHPNGYGKCIGTPFDLNDLAGEPNVLNGSVNLNNIVYVRLIDIPGSGDYFDDATNHIDPCTIPEWNSYGAKHPVYDPWFTIDSGGLDVEAVGVLHPQLYRGDINLDGVVNHMDFVILANAWRCQFGQYGWTSRCDINSPEDMIVDFLDFAVLAEDWMMIEQWRINQ